MTGTNQIRFTAAAGFLIEPRRAVSGDRVNILGRNFPAGQNSTVTVSVGGAAAQILFVSERVVTFTVPTNVTGGQVTLAVQGGAAVPVGVIAMQGVVITPAVVELDYAGQQPFTATVLGGTSQAVTWTVTDLRGRTSRVGSITLSGLYTTIPSAGGGTEPDFPFLVRATSDELRVAGYALVKLASNNRGPIGNRAVATGTLAVGERHGWQFTGQALQHVYIACLAASPLADLVLRDGNGVAVARSGPGSRLKLADVELPENGQYRIEVHGAGSPAGSYQLWLNQHAPLPHGIWMFPGDGAWEDGGNWSRGQLPTARDAVAIDFPSADLTITLGSGTHACSSVRSQEKLTLAGGVLTITGEIQVDNTWRMSGGTLAEAKVQPGVAGQMPMFGGYPSNLFDRVNVNGDLVMSELNARLRVAGGLRVNGTVYLRGGAATLGFVGTQSIAAGTTIVADGTDESARRIDAVGTEEVTIEAGAAIRGSRLVIGGGAEVNGTWTGALKLTNHGRISATSAPLNFELACVSFVNAAGGTLESVGGVLRVRAKSWTNAGRIVGQNGVIRLGESDQQQVWSSIGTIQMSGGLLSLGGRVTSTGIGLAGLSVNGGATVSVVGLIENQGRVLRLTGPNGTWLLQGGTLRGGDLDTRSSSLTVDSYRTNLLDDVTVQGDLLMPNRFSMTKVAGGLRVNGRVLMSGVNAWLGFDGSQDIAAGTTIVASGSPTLISAAVNRDITVMVQDGALIQGQSLIVFDGDGWAWPHRTLTFVNHGRISATSGPQNFEVACASFVNAAGGTLESVSGVLRVRAQSWTNAGRIVGQNGVIHLGESDQQQVWSSIGTIQMSGGLLSLGGRVTSTGIGLAGLSVNGGATVSVVGLIENQGRVLRLTGPNGTWLLQGGTLRGGDLDTRSSSLTVDSYRTNLLDDVTVQGDLLMPNRFSMIKVAGGLRVNGRVLMSGINAWLGFDGSQDIAAGTTIVASGSPTFFSAAVNSDITVTVQDGALIQGQSLIVFDGDAWAWPHRTLTFVNQGAMSVAAGGRIALDSAVAINEGSLEVLAGGTLALAQILTQRTPTAELRLIGGTVAAAATVDIQGGVTTGYGSITVLQPSLFRNGGILRPGGLGQPGRLSVQGDFAQVLGGRIEVELGGLIAGTEFDQIAVSGTAALTGVIRATLLGSFSPARTNAFDVLSCQSSIGDFAVYDLPPLGGGLSWTHGFSGTAPQRLVLAVQ